MQHPTPSPSGRSPRETILSRRWLLTGLLAGAAGVAAGCGTPNSAPITSPSSTAPTGPFATARPRARTTPRPSDSPSASPSATPSARSAAPRPVSAAEMVRRATVPVLCYHQIREWRGDDGAYARASLICPPRHFRRQLDALAEDGWTTISPDQYHAHLTRRAALPDKPVLLSFDDGSRGQVTRGLPELLERDMTATFFVMSVVLDKPTWMRRRDLAELADAGMTVGDHTYDHPGVDSIRGKGWKLQLEESRDTLRKASGQPVDSFAYPFGIVDRRAYAHLEKAGYRTAFQLEERKVDREAPLFTLRRILVGSTWSGAELLRNLRD